MVLDPSATRCVRLQLLLFFSGWYDMLFALLTIYTGWVKWRRLKGDIPLVFMAANFFVCFVLEPSRLYLGTAGNVREGVPEMSLFVVLSGLCSLVLAGETVLTSELGGLNAELELTPELCSLLPERPCVLPLERACWVVRAALAAVELCLGAAALRRLIREKSRRFFVALRTAQPRRREKAINFLDARLGQRPATYVHVRG
ncbi:unnamed protein product [Prorocentrum cordatum]|uniref:Uncharacterized protein n=1 Tax=Prorocentrum cordatum TaxID=2364126 RepID=A0ABN9QT77_9DINO|nr:unnamed protein product [Polarella glacialis]